MQMVDPKNKVKLKTSIAQKVNTRKCEMKEKLLREKMIARMIRMTKRKIFSIIGIKS